MANTSDQKEVVKKFKITNLHRGYIVRDGYGDSAVEGYSSDLNKHLFSCLAFLGDSMRDAIRTRTITIIIEDELKQSL